MRMVTSQLGSWVSVYSRPDGKLDNRRSFFSDVKFPDDFRRPGRLKPNGVKPLMEVPVVDEYGNVDGRVFTQRLGQALNSFTKKHGSAVHKLGKKVVEKERKRDAEDYKKRYGPGGGGGGSSSQVV